MDWKQITRIYQHNYTCWSQVEINLVLTLELPGKIESPVSPRKSSPLQKLVSYKLVKKYCPELRENHTFVSHKSKCILFGGIGFAEDAKRRVLYNDLWIATISTKKIAWNKPKVVRDEVHGLPSPRYGHTFVPFGSSLVLFGGYDGTSYLNDVWMLTDHTSDNEDVYEWSLISHDDKKCPAKRFFHSACVYKEEMLIFGGKSKIKIYGDVWSFSCKKRVWTLLEIPHFNPPPLYGHVSGLIHDYMFVFGGQTLEYNQNVIKSELYALDLVEMIWELQRVANPPVGRIQASSCVVDKEKLFISGGITFCKGYYRSDEMWILDTGLNSATKKVKYQDYVTFKEIGSGTYAQVYLAKKTTDQSLHALKRIVLDRGSSDVKGVSASINDSLKEVELLQTIRHEHILVIEEYFPVQKDEMVFLAIITPYCDLGSLYSYVMKTPLAEIEILFLLIQFFDGMKYLHAAEILHRDIKPQNILIETIDYGTERLPCIKIADFGFAKSVQGVSKGRTSTVVGTRNYMAPEISKNNSYSDSIDIWSIGCMLYFIFIRKEIDFKRKESRVGLEESFKKFKYGKQYVSWITQCIDEKVENRTSSKKLYDEASLLYCELYQYAEDEAWLFQAESPKELLPPKTNAKESPVPFGSPLPFLGSPGPTGSPNHTLITTGTKKVLDTPTDSGCVSEKQYLKPDGYLKLK
jgi:serine/threonine protein kinase